MTWLAAAMTDEDRAAAATGLVEADGFRVRLLAIDAEGRVYALDHTGDWYLGPDIDHALTDLVCGITPVRLTAS